MLLQHCCPFRGWSVCPGITWSICPESGGQFQAESPVKHSRIDLVKFSGISNWLKIIKDEEGAAAEKWVGILFKKQERYPDYDLAGVLNQLPIIYDKPLSPSLLLENLEQGALQPVQMTRYGKTLTYYISAAPEKRSINVYDARYRRIPEQAIIEENKASHRKASKEIKRRNKTN